MKTILTLFVLFFSSVVFADEIDIYDFQIEGISIGDSLLDHFSETFIKANESNYYTNKTYTPVEISQHQIFKTYDSMSFNYMTGDKNYIISHMSGRLKINNDMEECEKIKEVILKDIEDIFNNKTFRNTKGSHSADPSGKSIYNMDGLALDSGNKINITCYDYSEESGWSDGLVFSIRTKHFNDFLGYAYN